MVGISNPREKHIYALAKSIQLFMEQYDLLMRHNCCDDGAETCLGEECPVHDFCGEVLMLDSDLTDVTSKYNDVVMRMEDKFRFLS